MWYKLAEDYTGIQAVYGEEAPELQASQLNSINFDFMDSYMGEGGPAAILLLVFNPSNFPAAPPPKWVANGYNTCTITLRVVDVSWVQLSESAPRKGTCDIKIAQGDGHLTLEITGKNLLIKATFGQLYIHAITAYKAVG